MVRVTRRLLGGKSAESSWLRFVLDHAPVILFALDPRGRVTLSEGRGLEALGLRPGELVGRSVLDLYADEPTALAHLRRALAGEDFETIGALRTGQAFSTRFRSLRGARGEPAGTVGVAVDVTPERQALEALRQSEARLRLVTEQLPCIVWTTDRELRITAVAGRAASALDAELGARLEELSALTDCGMEAHRQALAGTPGEYRVTRGGRELDVHVAPFADEAGAPAGCIGLALDVTDRRRAEVAAARLQAEHGLLLDAVPAMVCFRDRSGVVQRCNRAFAAVFGQEPAQVQGRSLIDLLPENAARELDLDRQVFESGHPRLGVVEPCRLLGGGVLWLRMDRMPIGDAAAPDAILVCCVDVTSLKRAEEQLASSLSLLQATLESTADGLLVVDRQGRIVVHNRRFAELWGVPGDVLERGEDARALQAVLSRLVDPEGFMARVRALYETPEAEGQDVVELVDGRVLERFSRPQRIDGEVVGRLWSFRDVTARRKAEAERDRLLEAERAARARAQVAERWLSELVHGVDAIVWERQADSLDFSFVSDGGEVILGYPLDRWLAPGFWTHVVHPDDLPRVIAAARTMVSQRLELRVRAADGPYVWMQNNVRIVHDARGVATHQRGIMVDVTARKRAEEALQASEARLRHLFDYTPHVAIQGYDPEGRVCAWNRASEQMFGYTRDDALERDLGRIGLLAPEDAALFRRVLATVDGTGVPDGPREWRARCRDGTPVIVLSTVFAIPGSNEPRLYCMDVDITARKRAEEALQASEARLRAMVANTPNVGIQRYARDGRVLEWNPASEHIYGVPAARVLGRTLDEVGVFTPAQAASLRRTLDAIARSGTPCGPQEWSVRRGDGTPGVVLSTTFTVAGPEGDEFICMDVDVTRRRRAEEALERHASRLEVLARVSRRLDDAAFDAAAIARALARRIHEALGDGTAVHVRDDDGGPGLLERAGGPAALEAVARDPALLGRSALFSDDALAALVPAGGLASIALVPLAVHGRVLGTLCVGRAAGAPPHGPEALRLFEDLGERAALGLENARHFHAAQQAIRQRDEFLSVASHELRTPLQSLGLVVQGLSAAAARGGGLDAVPGEVIARGLDTVVRQEHRLARLVDALLDVTRLASGQLHLELEPVDLRQVVHDVVALFRGELVATRCDLRLDLPPAPLVGHWDRNRLEQVVSNLLSNACKYGAANPVDLVLAADDASVRLSVRDRGIGMSQETLRQIFQRFKRGVSARHYGGLGLGLFITRQIVEALGGRVEVESELGRGSTFTVVLPRVGPAEDGEATGP